MISLHLNNFKCWEHKKITFPLNKTVLIKAKSGKGKTSIIQAIIFALYGNIRKPCTFGKRKCSVTLDYTPVESKDKITITRSKGPNNLVVNYMNKKYEDYEAQHIINDIFSNYNLFPYIKQLGKHKLFEGTKNDKLEILKQVSFSNYDKIDKMLVSLKNKIYNNKILVDEIQKKYNNEKYHYEQELDKIKFKMKDYISFDRDETFKELQNLKETVSILEKNKKQEEINKEKYKNINQNIKEIIEEMNNITIASDDQILSMKEKISKLKIQMKCEIRDKDVKQEIQEYQNKLSKIESETLIFDDICNNINIYMNLLKQFESLDIKSFKDAKKKVDNYNEELKRKQEELEEQNKNIKCNEDIEKMNNNFYKCPNCSQPLKLKYSQLVKIEDYVEKQKVDFKINENLGEDIFNIKLKIKKLNDFLNSFGGCDVDVNCIKEHIEYVDIKKYILELKENISKNYITQKEYNSMELEYEKHKKHVKEYEKNKTKIDVLNDQLKRNKEKLSSIDLSGHINEQDIVNYNIEIKKIEKKLEEYKSYLYISKLIKNLKNLEKELEEASHKYNNTKLVHNICLECVCIKLQNTVSFINNKIELILDKIFEDPISIKLKTNRCTKSKKELKFEFSMDIHYKNNEYTSLSELSGGEQSRISIALTMAFNEVANSKMIILDESLNSLDTEHQNKVINILNRSGVSTFVISHSVTTGLFEKVIKL
jgi:DNA repair exonuclease SbcCD ATPase subunit